ncbi:MAG: TVP38/TMEM64 family protein [Streptococcaceae bacterium]|jgi:uncharacterized membrane protein YdjX (TVP38/TMEM64 family)|nr:TVP38/TMEM64 family protein [Streptococcaceae bacterium]
MQANVGKRIMNVASVFGLLATAGIVFYFIKLGVFTNQHALEGLIGDRIILGPIIFVAIQIIQVVVPIIPGGVSNVAGVLVFGPIYGFIYNFLGNVIGSIILYNLGKKYGKSFITTVVSDKTYDKYIGKIENSKKWDVFFTLMMISPVAPDDALVLMNSLTKMSTKKFIGIMTFGKFVSIAAYSYLLLYGGQFVTNFFFK